MVIVLVTQFNVAFQSRSSAYSTILTFQVSLSLWDTSEACGADYREEQVNLVLGTVKHPCLKNCLKRRHTFMKNRPNF